MLFHCRTEGGIYETPRIYSVARLSPIRIFKYMIEDTICFPFINRLQRNRTAYWQRRLMKQIGTHAGRIFHAEQTKRWMEKQK
jgi:hypothetical protein